MIAVEASDDLIEPIDEEVALFVSSILDGSTEGLDIPAQRAAAERKRERWRAGGPAMVRREDRTVHTDAGDVRVRLLSAEPQSEEDLPALVYIHGGGFTFFSLETHDRLMREYAARSGAVVVGVDYSLSPEARFPTALHEVAGVVRWLTDGGAGIGVDPARVAVGGDSAGANLSVAASLLLRDAGEGSRIAALLLNYGFFDADRSTASHRRHGQPGKLLTSDELDFYLDMYLGGTAHADDPLALPILADLRDLPPSLHVIAQCDPLADGDRAMARRLEEAGNRVEARVYRGATHSFLEAVSVSSLADRALAESSDWLRRALAPRAAVA